MVGNILKVAFLVYAIGGMIGGFYILVTGNAEPIPNYDDWGHSEW